MGHSETLRVTLELDASAPAAARDRLEDVRQQLDFGVFELLRLLVSELVTYAVRQRARELELAIEPDAGGVRATATSPEGSLSWQPSRDPHGDGEWGLYLVNRLADRWGSSEQAAAAVWFEIAPGA